MAENIKRFAVFGGERHYASGGFHDFMTSFATLNEAEAYAASILGTDIKRNGYDATVEWWHVADIETGIIKAQSAHGAY